MNRARFLLPAALLATVAAGADKIAWQTDFQAAQKLAKRLKRPIVVDFYADW